MNPDHHGNMFFWHFENKHLANRHRTVIWLNGGPGCSSLDGALMEIGPYKLKDEETLEYQPDSWNEFANLLFVDNPVGTGFSYVDADSYLHELPEMAAHFTIFLERYFQLFPEEEGNDVRFHPSRPGVADFYSSILLASLMQGSISHTLQKRCSSTMLKMRIRNGISKAC